MQGGIGINISGKETFLIWGSMKDWKAGVEMRADLNVGSL